MYNLINDICTKYYIIHDAATILTYKYYNVLTLHFTNANYIHKNLQHEKFNCENDFNNNHALTKIITM